MVLLLDIGASSFPLVQHGYLETMRIAGLSEKSVFVRDHHLLGEQQFAFHQCGMIAALLDFPNR